MATQSTVQETEHFLSLSITSSLKAMLPTQQLAEVINIAPHEIVPLPQMSSSVVGVFPWQGEVLWVVDLSYWMGFDPLLTENFSQSNCSILKVKNQGKSLGILIYKVGKMICCQPQKNQSSPVDLPESILEHPTRKNCIKGAWIDPQGERFLILDTTSIASLED